MWPNPQGTAALVIFIEKSLYEKFIFIFVQCLAYTLCDNTFFPEVEKLGQFMTSRPIEVTQKDIAL